jgi:hypothetical protein
VWPLGGDPLPRAWMARVRIDSASRDVDATVNAAALLFGSSQDEKVIIDLALESYGEPQEVSTAIGPERMLSISCSSGYCTTDELPESLSEQ